MTRSRIPIFAFAALFLAAVFGSWAWFNTDIGRSASEVSGPWSLVSGPQDRVWLTARTNIPGYIFIPEPASESVKKTLGTTNILSGSFYKILGNGNQKPEVINESSIVRSHDQRAALDSRISTDNLMLDIRALTSGTDSKTTLGPRLSTLDPASRTTVFFASWPDGDTKGLAAIKHTPDICWGGSGWKPLDLGQPRQLIPEIPKFPIRPSVLEQSETNFGGEALTDGSHPVSKISRLPSSSLPIASDFRIFLLPDGQSREAVVWLALTGSKSLAEATDWESETVASESAAHRLWIQAVRLGRFLRYENRLQVHMGKQFVRCSMPLKSDWRSAVEAINGFAHVWLSVRDIPDEHQ